MLFLVFLNKDKIGRKVVEIVAWELDREREKEVGYYNVVEWNDGTFQINHSSSGNRFEMLKNNTTIVLLENISDYKVKNHQLYVCSEDGMAIITEDNMAMIYILNYDEERDKEHIVYKDDKQIIYSKNYNDKNISYIDGFEQFAERDKKVLKKMLK